MKKNNDKNSFKFKNLYNFLNFYCEKYKKKIFYLAQKKNETITYASLLKIINNFGFFLEKRKIKKNDKILVILDNSKSLVTIFLSIIYNQRIFVPVNPNISNIELNYIVNKTNPKFAIIDKDLKRKFKLKIKQKFYLDQNNFIQKILKIKSKKFKIKKINNKQISQILFTSGSTGNPKGVVLTHNSMLTNLFGLFKAFNIQEKNAKFLSVTPLYHNNGQFIPTLIPIMIGGSTFSISPDTSLINFWPIVKKYKINFSSVMATHINYFNTINYKLKHNLKSVFCGGAKLDCKSQNNFEKKFKVKVLCNYGLTETSSIAATQTLIKSKINNGSVGKPLINNKIKISKLKKNYGEILIKGENIFKEYLKERKLTKSKFKDNWFKTGDLGHFDKNGNLYIKDRIDNMIIVSGENIYPSEIENHIYQFKDIRLGIISSIPNELTQNKLVLVYESEKDIQYENFYKFMKKKITRFKIPKEIINVKKIGLQQIPKAANKKILRKKLNDKILSYYLNK